MGIGQFRINAAAQDVVCLKGRRMPAGYGNAFSIKNPADVFDASRDEPHTGSRGAAARALWGIEYDLNIDLTAAQFP